MNVGQKQISRWENGEVSFTPDQLVKLSEFFHVSVDYLLGLTEDPFPAVRLDAREGEIVRTYHMLDERGKDMIDITLKEQSRYASLPEKEAP